MKFSIADRAFLELDFENQKLAVSGSDHDLSWAKLEVRSKYYEEKLLNLGISSGQNVAIIGHKQADYIATMCACVKLKCTYIPLDNIYPEDRVNKILNIANVFCKIDLDKQVIEKNINYNADIADKNDSDVIYIIFTSGSTGEPKGVQILKESVVSMLQWMKEDFSLPENTVFMNQALFSFDLSVYETMYALNFGESLILNDRNVINTESFILRVKEAKINTWVSTPSFAWSKCIQDNFNSQYLPELKCFLFCGEILSKKLFKKLKNLFPEAKIYNTYGPTEATVATTFVEITSELYDKYETLPVGYAKKGTAVYVDESGQICISGPNVMKSYLNREDLNQSKMFSNNGMRGFRTGDLGFVENDLIFCQGRIDDQIKLHGYRIELSEIDHGLTRSSEVSEALSVPVMRGGEVLRIIAFVKLERSNSNYSIFTRDIALSLPTYMIPSEFIKVDEFPINQNHKIDKNKLMELYKNNELKKWV